jgi:farnesyl diphosphate synthase
MSLDPIDNPIARTERILDRLLPAETIAPIRLHSAMRYGTLNGGKRIRAQLVYATGFLLGCRVENMDPAAAALELIHAFSLIHDDLPAMDNDALRRGKPTVHVAFDQATAILAGDALQTLAFETLASADWPDAVKVSVLKLLLSATGSKGMCGGQQLDMDASGKTLGLDDLQRVHALKTGALIKAAILIPAAIAGADSDDTEALKAFADDLGLAFQIQDDILDIEASTEQLGKSAGKDAAQAKSTYPALLGLDGAKTLLTQLAERMAARLRRFDDRADWLRELAEFAVNRRN